MANDTTTIQDNIVKIDNVYNALNYLLEEIQSKKDQIVRAADVNQKVIDQMETRCFRETMLNYIRDSYGQGLYQEVAFLVMEKIDDSIVEFINTRVDERLRAAGVNVPEAVVGG
jgi:tRNA A37 N6-isopentenylltransferase MiaA